jgi:Tat protein secretion system quality control protein TatD with DNase activity
MKFFLRQLQVCALRHATGRFGDKIAQLAKEVSLPLYLHSRDTMGDFCRVMASAGRGDADDTAHRFECKT